MGASLMSLYRTNGFSLTKPRIGLQSQSRWPLYTVNAQSFAGPEYRQHCRHVVDSAKAMISPSFPGCGRVCCGIIELSPDGFHVLLAISKTDPSPFCGRPPSRGCLSSQVLNSLSFRNNSFKASLTTYDSEELMNSAYFWSFALTCSSTRICSVSFFGGLGGDFRIAISFLPSPLQVMRKPVRHRDSAPHVRAHRGHRFDLVAEPRRLEVGLPH
jgi:hypothetical protein